jgi:hypothetical protein
VIVARTSQITVATPRRGTSSWSSPPARNGTFNTAPNNQKTSNPVLVHPFRAPRATTAEAAAYIARAIAQASW